MARPNPCEAARIGNASAPKRSKSWWYYVLFLAAFFILTVGPYLMHGIYITVPGNVEARWGVVVLLPYSIATFGLLVTRMFVGLAKVVRDNQPAASANRSSQIRMQSHTKVESEHANTCGLMQPEKTTAPYGILCQGMRPGSTGSASI